ncbi:unnamed protein product [Clonostachys solani]|uniref:Arrestin-like N-terminal domain-containing protein n=1 Tax=Clonostachys solani TaxID=160281 RepID=A0A9N9W5A1_9HYPO|nr:unnamed protein product [Clonostachys solani]
MDLFKSDSLNSTLGIELDAEHPYRPGDVATGRIYRKPPAACDHATLKLRLNGQVRTKIPQFNGQMQILDQSQVVHDGRIHLPSGQLRQDWPFTLTIPTHIDSACLPADANPKKYFFPLRNDDGTTAILPPSFDGTYDSDRKAVIEYTLEAEMELEGQGKRGKSKAVLPITIEYFRAGEPLSSTPFNFCQKELSVSSQRLIPGKENTKLSTSQQMKGLFSSRSTPAFTFQLIIAIPKLIQLGNPYFVPFQMKATPLWDKSHESLRKSPPKIVVKRFALEAITRVTVMGPLNSGVGRFWDRNKIINTNLALMRLGHELEVPCDEASTPAVDLGNAVKFQIPYEKEMNFHANHLRPSLDTHLIRNVHILKWRVEIDVVGKNFVIEDHHYFQAVPPVSPYPAHSTPGGKEDAGL